MNAPCTIVERRRAATHPLALPAAFAMLIVVSLALTGCGSGQKTETVSEPTGQYSFWPPLPNEPRIQFLTSYRYSSDVEPEQSAIDKLVFGKEQVVLAIGKPYGIDMWNGRIYVCDVTNPGVFILDLNGRQTQLMGQTGADRLALPVDIDIAPDGLKYVVDRRLSRIFVFNRDDAHVASFSPRGASPVGVTVRGGDLLVADSESQTVLVMDRFSGEVKGHIGTAGGGEGGFIFPLGVDVDPAGNLFVTDAIQSKLQEFDDEGALIRSIGQAADSPGNFVRPKHVAVDAEGNVYVVDAAFQNVQMFNNEGELLMFFGSPGDHAGSMSLPAGITVTEDDIDLFEPYIHPAFDAQRLVLVTNQFGLHKVSVYAMGKLKEGRTIADIAPFVADIESGLQAEDEQQPGQMPLEGGDAEQDADAGNSEGGAAPPR